MRLELASAAWLVVLGIVPIVAIAVTGIVTGTIPEGAERGYLAHGPDYPAFTSLSAGLLVPALALVAAWVLALPLPLKDPVGPHRLELGALCALGTAVAATASALDVREPSVFALAGAAAAVIFFLTLLLYIVRSVLGWLRLVPRSWRAERAPRRRRR